MEIILRGAPEWISIVTGIHMNVFRLSGDGLDCGLVGDARRFITGANVHAVKTWIYCYEMSAPGTTRRKRYEDLLRDFVSSRSRLETMSARVEAQNKKVMELSVISSAINRRIERLLTSSSD
jgi:hypothetical protein